MSRKSKYKLKDSDRSGFTFKEIELVKDKGHLVGPDEFDMPPPSNKSTGGEGVVLNPESRMNGTTSYAATTSRYTEFVTASGGIVFVQIPDSQGKFDTNNQWIYAAGVSATTDISVNPQISRGYQNSLITIQCVSNNIVLENSNGLVINRSLNGSRIFNMNSGSIITLIFNATDNLWHETSRSHFNGGF